MALIGDILTNIKAYVYSTVAHSGQTRKFSNMPYIKHPRSVRSRLLRFGVKDPDILAASLLHDTLEDTKVTYDLLVKHFNKRVADIVKWLTNPEGKKNEHIAKVIATAPYEVVVIKVFDRIDNLEDEHDSEFIKRYKKTSTTILDELKKRGFTKLYNEYLVTYNKYYA